MFSKLILISALVMLVAFSQYEGPEGCKHDKFAFRPARNCVKSVPAPNPDGLVACPVRATLTATSKPAPIRVTFDTANLFAALTVTTPATTVAALTAYKAVITQATVVIQKYLAQLLQVIPEVGNNKNYLPVAKSATLAIGVALATASAQGYVWTSALLPKILNTAGTATLQAQGAGIAASDLHIILSAETTLNAQTTTEQPYGVAVSWLPTLSFHPDRPNIGIIKFPFAWIAKIKQQTAYTAKPIDQKYLFNTLLHQVFHILGISMSEVTYWKKWTQDGSLAYYTQTDEEEDIYFKVDQTYYLGTPSVTQAAMNQYQSSQNSDGEFYEAEIKHRWGMQLEDTGDDNDNYATGLYSHWEFTTTLGEIMTPWGYAGIQLPSLVSELTLAALQDTGYYAFVNMQLAELFPYGIEAGWNFFTGSCEYEYTPPFTCDFYSFGPETKQTQEDIKFIDDYCTLSITTEEESCLNDVAPRDDQFVTFQQYGPNSRCFQSNIVARQRGQDWRQGPPFGDQGYDNYRCYNTFSQHSQTYGLFNKDGAPQFDYSFNIGKKRFDFFTIFDGEWRQFEDPHLDLIFGDKKKKLEFSRSSVYHDDRYINAGVDSYSLGLEVLSGVLTPEIEDLIDLIVFSVGTECPNFCSLNGFCVHGKQNCQCLDTFFGPDCSLKAATACPPKFFFDQITADCFPACPPGRFVSGTQCIRCPWGCDVCTNAATCTRCTKDFFSVGPAVCTPECPRFYYTSNLVPGSCLTCPQITANPVGGKFDLDCKWCFKNGDDACLSCYEHDNTTCFLAVVG